MFLIAKMGTKTKHNGNFWCLEGLWESAAALDLSLSLCLWFLWIGHLWSLANSAEAFYSEGNLSISQRRNNFMGAKCEAVCALHTHKKAEETVSVFSCWGPVQLRLKQGRTHSHTHINCPRAHKYTHCHAFMHRLPHAHLHKLWTLRHSLLTCKHTNGCARTQTHTVVFAFGSVAQEFKILDYGNVPELFNLLSSHS